MNNDVITIQDCIEMLAYKDCVTIINDGKIIGFEKEKENNK